MRQRKKEKEKEEKKSITLNSIIENKTNIYILVDISYIRCRIEMIFTST